MTPTNSARKQMVKVYKYSTWGKKKQNNSDKQLRTQNEWEIHTNYKLFICSFQEMQLFITFQKHLME